MNNFLTLAGITTYNPSITRFRLSIESICNQVDKVLIVDNGSQNSKEIKKITGEYRNILFICLGENKGIAYAMNTIGGYAYKNGYSWFLTLDQDSVCPDNLISTYQSAIKVNVGIIVPSIEFNQRFIGQLLRKKKRVKIIKKPEYEEVLYAVSSGQFIRTEAWSKANGFWNFLFIDFVDQEFCLNITRLGYKIIRANYCELDHEPGIQIKIMGIPTAKQNAIREYYCARNGRLVYWLYKKEFCAVLPHKPFLLTCKRIANVLLIREDTLNKLSSIFKGIFDAYRWRLKYGCSKRVP